MQNTLDNWLAERPGKSKELAQFLGVSESHLSQVRRGRRRLRTPWMLQIEEFTNHHVTVVQMVRDVTEEERLKRSRT
jgi:DNA-binding transcriptional regulator YdaS (Cro superfamily)